MSAEIDEYPSLHFQEKNQRHTDGQRENSIHHPAPRNAGAVVVVVVGGGGSKKVREKSRECHNHKPQPILDTKRKRKQTKQAQIKQSYEKHKD